MKPSIPASATPLAIGRLSQSPLTSPTGARLVLCNDDSGYPDSSSGADSSSPLRGRWFNNIANIDTATFLRVRNSKDDRGGDWIMHWKWPAVVLTSEECNLHVGGMSITGLRGQLEKYWGRCGIPGIVDGGDYQDMWVPAWAPDGTRDPYDLSWQQHSWEKAPQEALRLDPETFSHWVNGECTKWFDYFIAENHVFGAVHAWFTAFLAITRDSLRAIAVSLNEYLAQYGDSRSAAVAAISNLKFRMSFEICIKDHDEVLDGLPSVPGEIEIMTDSRGTSVISGWIRKLYPRRMWDICANTVIPISWLCGRGSFPAVGQLRSIPGLRPVSHAWVADEDMAFDLTGANQQLWPIPLPKGVLVEDVRREMIRLGVRYAWLDVLCLRQQAQPALAKSWVVPINEEIIVKREQCRIQEWKIDVPTIGAVYSDLDETSLYGGGPTVIFMSGLGLPFRPEGWDGQRHWLRRAWTLQETMVPGRCLIAGLPEGAYYQRDSIENGDRWPWNCKVGDGGQLLHEVVSTASCIQVDTMDSLANLQQALASKYTNVDDLFRAMRGRYSSNPMDKVFAIAFPLQKNSLIGKRVTLPIYNPSEPLSEAWDRLISSIASTTINPSDALLMRGSRECKGNELRLADYSPTIQLLRLFTHSPGHWFPSWAQVQQYPDISVKGNDLAASMELQLQVDTAERGMEYCLRIETGRIYRGCSFQLIQPPSPGKEAVYLCTMDDSEDTAQLVATVPGIELRIDPTSKYVLVDISPDRSLWPWSKNPEDPRGCMKTAIGHEHLPIWEKSVVVVCKEVVTLAEAASDAIGNKLGNINTRPSTAMKYYLRRVTTLDWDCTLPPEPETQAAAEPSSLGHGRWLPFSPSLVHKWSIVCSVKGSPPRGYFSEIPHVFCEPEAITDLDNHQQWPSYEVYLV